MSESVPLEKPNYRDIYKTFTKDDKDKIKRRQLFLYEFTFETIKSLKCEDLTYINVDLIFEIILNYFTDIKRLKEFHEIEKSDFIKIASYTSYWFSRFRPIQIKENVQITQNSNLTYINERTAVLLIFNILFDQTVIYTLEVNDLKQYNRFLEHLIYFFIYRPTTPQAIEMIFLAFLSRPMHPVKKINHF